MYNRVYELNDKKYYKISEKLVDKIFNEVDESELAVFSVKTANKVSTLLELDKYNKEQLFYLRNGFVLKVKEVSESTANNELKLFKLLLKFNLCISIIDYYIVHKYSKEENY